MYSFDMIFLVGPNVVMNSAHPSLYSTPSSSRWLSEDDDAQQQIVVKRKKLKNTEDSNSEDKEAPLRKQKRRRHVTQNLSSDILEKKQQLEDLGIEVTVQTKEKVETAKPIQRTVISSHPEEEVISVTDKPTAPQLKLSITRVFPHNVTTSVQVTVPSRVWCTVRSSDDSEPTVNMLKRLVPRDVTDAIYIDYDWLKSKTPYMFYCYGEGLNGLPMKDRIRNIGVAFITPDEEGAGNHSNFIQIKVNLLFLMFIVLLLRSLLPSPSH